MSNQELEEFIGSLLKGIGVFFYDVAVGLKQVMMKKSRIYILVGMISVILILYLIRVPVNERFIPASYHKYSLHFEAFLIIPLFYLYFLGDTWRNYIRSFERIFESVGLYSSLQIQSKNLSGNVEKKKDLPKYIREKREGKSTIYYFTSNGLSIDDWKKKQMQLETTMDSHIIKFEQDQHTKRYMKMFTIKAKDSLKDNYRWHDEYISEDDFEIVIGEGLLQQIKINFEKVPHLLLAGETGAGKSVLQNCLTWQIIRKGGRVYMIDFKGGIELDHFKEYGPVMWDRKKVIEVLRILIKEHEKRVELFKEVGVKKLSEYNAGVSDEGKLSRCFLIVDEAAELLDKDGADEEETEEITIIEGLIKKLARLARAQGIHMIMATQRPDTKVITGQIRNNLPGRISGKMTDKEPSMMALGSTKAVDLPDIQGRFLYKSGVNMHEFQAYFFKTGDIKKGCYAKGKMLIDAEEKAKNNIKGNVIKVEDAEENGLIISSKKPSENIQMKKSLKKEENESSKSILKSRKTVDLSGFENYISDDDF